MKKAILISIISLVAGALLVLEGYFVYTVIRTQNQVEKNTATISQIVQFLNSQVAKNTPEVK
jgi:flagellar basal body-associated protein FliL